MNRESIPVFEEVVAPGVAPRARALDAPCAALAWLLPLLLGISAARAEPAWADDLGIVRDLGFARVGLEGVLSTLLSQLAALVPIGGRMLRVSLVGVLALALASRLLFGAVRAQLDRRGAASIHPLLALLSSSFWALGPVVLGAATRAGGPLVAVALVVIVLRLLPDAFEQGDARALVYSGLAVGAALAESHVAGACLVGLLAGVAFARRACAWPRHAGRLVTSFAFAFVLLSSLRWGWPSAAPVLPPGGASLDLSGVPTLEPGLLGVGSLRQPFSRAVAELGTVVLALAGAGVALALADRRLRRALGPVAWLFALAQVIPGALSTQSSAFGGAVSSLALAAFFPVPIARAVTALWGSSLPLGRHAAVLCVTFASTLVLSRTDQALGARPSRQAVEAWTDQALAGLPDESLVLVHTPALAYRMLAARVLHGTRPDVTVLPSGAISAGSFGRELARTDPNAAPLLRQLWVNAVADEYSLSRLADERPVLVELDRKWDEPLLDHLRPEGAWFGFSAHALGRSERDEAAARARASLVQLIERAGGEAALDPDTRRVVSDALGQKALVTAVLGEREAARRWLRAARRVDRRSPLVRELAALLAGDSGARVAASALLE